MCRKVKGYVVSQWTLPELVLPPLTSVGEHEVVGSTPIGCTYNLPKCDTSKSRALILTRLVLLGYRADVMSAFLVSWQ